MTTSLLELLIAAKNSKIFKVNCKCKQIFHHKFHVLNFLNSDFIFSVIVICVLEFCLIHLLHFHRCLCQLEHQYHHVHCVTSLCYFFLSSFHISFFTNVSVCFKIWDSSTSLISSTAVSSPLSIHCFILFFGIWDLGYKKGDKV